MKKIGLFYSFNTNKTAQVAKKILENFDKDTIEAVNAEEVTEDQFTRYDNLILGCPTWFDGELPNYWDEFLPALEDLKLKGKDDSPEAIREAAKQFESIFTGMMLKSMRAE